MGNPLENAKWRADASQDGPFSYCSHSKSASSAERTATILAAANEYMDELEDLSKEDKMVLKSTFTDLTVDSPRTELAVTRFKKVYSKIDPTAGEVLKIIPSSVATEIAKKQMGL
jgi:hypothetical protein